MLSNQVLSARVKQLIREARELIPKELQEGEAGHTVIKQPEKVIVRLRVDYTGEGRGM